MNTTRKRTWIDDLMSLVSWILIYFMCILAVLIIFSGQLFYAALVAVLLVVALKVAPEPRW
jgi:hypothetical protein